MWKAIWTGLAGLLLGVVLGESFGGAQGAVLGTVAGAVLGAPPAFLAARACRSPCRGCTVVCKTPKRSRVPGVATVVVSATLAAVVARAALGLAAPFLLPLEAVALGACVAARAGLLRLSPVLQRTGRLGLRSGPLAHKLAAQHARRPPRGVRCPEQIAAALQAALPRGSSLRALPAAVPKVIPGEAVASNYVVMPREFREKA